MEEDELQIMTEFYFRCHVEENEAVANSIGRHSLPTKNRTTISSRNPIPRNISREIFGNI